MKRESIPSVYIHMFIELVDETHAELTKAEAAGRDCIVIDLGKITVEAKEAERIGVFMRAVLAISGFELGKEESTPNLIYVFRHPDVRARAGVPIKPPEGLKN
jgi:hypothetical protein